MAEEPLPEERITEEIYLMNVEENRLLSFKLDVWPHSGLCSPAKMAKAGFYHCPTEEEPDGVRCFVCLKELDGWQPEDDPWLEHVAHCPRCPFVILGKSQSQLTLRECLELESQRYVTLQERNGARKLKIFDEALQAAWASMFTPKRILPAAGN